jgi:hypothetical protein
VGSGSEVAHETTHGDIEDAEAEGTKDQWANAAARWLFAQKDLAERGAYEAAMAEGTRRQVQRCAIRADMVDVVDNIVRQSNSMRRKVAQRNVQQGKIVSATGKVFDVRRYRVCCDGDNVRLL